MVDACIDSSFESWRDQARALLASGIPPREVVWRERADAQPALPNLAQAAPRAGTARVLIPRRFVSLARLASRHRAPHRWDLLYRILCRLAHEDRALLDRTADPDVAALERLVRQVRADVGRMKAFVRFRSIGPPGSEYFVAWHRPDHDVAALVAPHFARRYPNMRWSIFTPSASLHWGGGRLEVGAGVSVDALPSEDSNAAAERLWRTYYAAAFNPARVNPGKLARDLPARFRESLPEAAVIPALVAGAPSQAQRLREATGGVTVRAVVPEAGDLAALRLAAAGCRACPLHAAATQTVFGEGPPDARLVLVGEQPGDVEDRSGRPFTGPAGEVLDNALAAAGISRRDAYVTNAVKHFAWEPRGKRRIHRTPRLSEVRACRPWLEAELGRLQPRVIVCLGRTAAQTLLGPQARVAALRGRTITGLAWAPALVVTLHPSAILRTDGEASRAAAFDMLVHDLRVARAALGAPAEAMHDGSPVGYEAIGQSPADTVRRNLPYPGGRAPFPPH